MCQTFSIPNRIEPSATKSFDGLSKEEITFSIPNRIEPSATDFDESKRGHPFCLSVSPIGSSPLQLGGTDDLVQTGYHFQYPQSDRALCNSPRPGSRMLME